LKEEGLKNMGGGGGIAAYRITRKEMGGKKGQLERKAIRKRQESLRGKKRWYPIKN